ncbi:low molecular weight phosphatase family protein [Tautonia sociabilis]|uniref:Phosphotyrosine protein phosphatase I domain-containing protein n=1 Tax=Tautonia sociabilis TaxID=2080755 RepID=A0A432MFW4_9BACT|nr:hypothetical protein [Tautonia sociabilis]RUL85274.1 hypothetical protein TsocGM_18875 [Tautonia sociabilis]
MPRIAPVRTSWRLVPIRIPIAPAASGGPGDGPLARALGLVRRNGTAEAVLPENVASAKGRLAKALGPDGVPTAAEPLPLIDRPAFDRLAGADGRIDAGELEAIVTADVPESRALLIPAVRAHADLLTTSFDRIDPPHRRAGGWLADWIAGHYAPGEPLHVIVICTGNSRRSMMGAAMGNVAASYYGLPEVRFHSGGTEPSAFNDRTVAALREIGLEVEPTGVEAPRGGSGIPNPMYSIRWGDAPAMRALEFSKTYNDASNPREGFAAVLVCGEADEACPVVPGAAVRIPMPYLDPKVFDDTPFEAAKYAERRDDLGRLLLSVMMHVRNRIDAR